MKSFNKCLISSLTNILKQNFAFLLYTELKVTNGFSFIKFNGKKNVCFICITNIS